MASGSKELYIDSSWHGSGKPKRGADGTLRASFDGLTISVSFNGRCKQLSTGAVDYSPSYMDHYYITLDGETISNTAECGITWTSNFSLSGSKSDVSVGSHTINLMAGCRDLYGTGQTCNNNYHAPVSIGSITLDVPSPYTPPSYAIVRMNDNIGRVDTSNGYQIEYYIRRWNK